MIESISVANVATYPATPESLTGLLEFNYLFGSNGTGKTTISRVIADESKHPTCFVTWKGGTKLETMVYNRDFIDRVFLQSAELPGVFTLGEKQKDTLEKIAVAKKEHDDLTVKIETLTHGLQGEDGQGGKNGELRALETELKNKCWEQKRKYDAKLQGAFGGFRGSADKFKAKVIQEIDSNKSSLLTLAELEKKAESVFGETPINEHPVADIDTDIARIIAHEKNPILKKRIIGKEDVDIAAMIKKLGNSDWVREGRSFYEVNDGTCPFCQQSTTETLAKSLNEYFDETFVKDSKSIDELVANYATDADRLQQQLASIIASQSKFLDVEKLKSEKELLTAKITLNNQRLATKKKEASQVVELESLSNILAAIKSLIVSANEKIDTHNQLVAHIEKAREELTDQVWRFVIEELKTELSSYKTEKNALDKAIASMTKQIAEATADKVKKHAEIRALEKQTTSVQPTIDAINALLAAFGFQSFKLAKAASGNSYKLIRTDGSDAKMTLSEGEKTFVTFLYFYNLLKGSESDSGMTTNRIVVFDDPVSSLDSEILFIVSSLIKGLVDDVRSKIGHIKQVFVLTHNVYFHKEVTFNTKRQKKAMNEETFWVVRKSGQCSKIEKHNSNPIKTSYDLLWSEVRREDRSNLTIQNTLRRILENYFKILGGVDSDRICELFFGKEKLICKSLFSWINDGSHFAHDDLYISIDDSMVEVYLKVFREIFKKSDHFAHYKMMMGNAFVDDEPDNPNEQDDVENALTPESTVGDLTAKK
ncbi:wobble nucleotide-excising tRNase [Ereboglobus sp. PH5-5]|uniref:ATP-binding protein n=1 Tax=Ereboglobus sp. PH5-5 TaxID=2940529 RepID=UPI0024056F21|nr:AAA family ATPase [Ereboglobus sp. PH5-5]MDF9833011.1 wobble nucleotide-excising tRNase [Ereboglobus sp. PH5-5]